MCYYLITVWTIAKESETTECGSVESSLSLSFYSKSVFHWLQKKRIKIENHLLILSFLHCCLQQHENQAFHQQSYMHQGFNASSKGVTEALFYSTKPLPNHLEVESGQCGPHTILRAGCMELYLGASMAMNWTVQNECHFLRWHIFKFYFDQGLLDIGKQQLFTNFTSDRGFTNI